MKIYIPPSDRKRDRESHAKKKVMAWLKQGNGMLVKTYLRGVESGLKPIVLAELTDERDGGITLRTNFCDVADIARFTPEDASAIAKIPHSDFPVVAFGLQLDTSKTSYFYSFVIGVPRPN